jgi:DNA-binding IclR family transcriptional regulator
MVPAVDRSFRILDLLSRSPAPLGTSEVARRLRLAKSTVHGLLRSLEAVGAVEQVRQRYRLGPAVGRLAAIAELRRRWRPVLERVAEETGETSFLAQPRGSRVAIVDEVPGAGAPIVSAPVGSFVPATAGAVRKVLAGARLAEDHGEYLEGVNAVAAAVPGGVLFVAGFGARLPAERLAEVGRLLERLTCE